MKRKTLSIILSLLMTASLLLSACGETQTPANSAEPEETPAEATQNETPEPTPAETEEQPWEVEPQPLSVPKNAVEVSTVDSLLVAIGPNTTIALAPGVYDLTTASDYGNTRKSGCYRWEETYDGFELVIEGVDNLWILAPDGAEIQTRPRYSNVLRFDSCRDLALAGLTLGHTEEPGVCSGGVLDLSGCERVRLESCSFFGCGTIGINASNCRDLAASFCEIYDCSYAALDAYNVQSMRLDDCRIHDCGEKNYGVCPNLISAVNCRGFALVNTRITGNHADVLFNSQQSFGAAMLGCLVEDNEARMVFTLQGKPILVEDCGFSLHKDERFYMENQALFAQDRNGNDLISFDLGRMQRQRANYEGYKAPQAAEPQLNVTQMEDGTREIHVNNVEELLAAIAPDTTVILAPGDYDLSDASDYGDSRSEWYTWEPRYDGYCLVLSGVDHFSLQGAGRENTRILAEPRYADVLMFINSEGVKLSNFTAGHTDGEGECGGNVVEFSFCSDVEISNCGYFGCGLVGLVAIDCSGLLVSNTDLYACTGNGADFFNCNQVQMNNCSIYDCRDNQNLIYVTSSQVVFDGVTLSEGIHRFDHHSYLGLENMDG